MSATKEDIRDQARKHRDHINPFSEDPDDACSLFFEHINPAQEQVVSLYWPKGREFDSTPFFERLTKEKICCALPVIKKDSRELGFVEWHKKTKLQKGPFGVQEPVIKKRTKWLDPDIVIVPLLAFDRKGYRIGYGGGYYDTTLKSLRQKKEITAVGIGYAQQAVIFNLPVEPHDQKLDWIITPKQAHSFL